MEDMESNLPMAGGIPGADKGLVDVQSAAAIARIQGQMVIAKKFPRDEAQALARIRQAAGRQRLAEQAEYEYVRGGSKVVGPSIRAAEAVAQAWGNMDMGVVELKREAGKESIAMAYAVDLETNTTKSITFAVPHIRDTRQGGKALTETRDIYETVMNAGSRRLRNCIMAVVPSDIMETFVEEANRTLSANKVPLKERIPPMLAALETVSVTKAMVEQTYSCRVDALTDRQLAEIRRKYQAIKDGFGGIEDYFRVPQAPEAGKGAALNQKQKAQAGASAPAAPSATEQKEPGSDG